MIFWFQQTVITLVCSLSEWFGEHEDSDECSAVWSKQKWTFTEQPEWWAKSGWKPSQKSQKQTKHWHAITGDATLWVSILVSVWLLLAFRLLAGAAMLSVEERTLHNLLPALFNSGCQSLRPGDRFVLCGSPSRAAWGGSAAPWGLCSIH